MKRRNVKVSASARKLERLAREVFGFERLWPVQIEAIQSVLLDREWTLFPGDHRTNGAGCRGGRHDPAPMKAGSHTEPVGSCGGHIDDWVCIRGSGVPAFTRVLSDNSGLFEPL